MSKEIISDKQGITMMAMFIMGSTLILGAGGEAKQDVWIAILLAIAFAIPALFVYSRLLSLYPGKDLFDILEIIFGKIISKFIQILFIWYAFHLGALVIRNFTEFIRIVAMPETPPFITNIFLGIVCILAIKDGIEVLGRVTTFILPILITIILFVVLLSTSDIQLSNLKPVLYDGFKPVLKGAFSTFSFPLAETVVFTMVYSSLKSKGSSYKVYYLGLLIGSLLMVIVSVRNLLVLGPETASILYFPSYSAVSVVNIGEILQRIEVTVAVVFLFAGFTKVSICMYAATNGIVKTFNLGDYRNMVAPVGLLMVLLTRIIYENAMEMVEWAKYVYPYYAIPFQIILPIVILIVAEVRIRSRKQGIASRDIE